MIRINVNQRFKGFFAYVFAVVMAMSLLSACSVQGQGSGRDASKSTDRVSRADKADSLKSSASSNQMSGTYVNRRGFNFEFDEDGSVVWTDEYASWPGTYKVSDGVVKITVSQLGGSAERFDFEIRGNQLVDMEYDNVYVKQDESANRSSGYASESFALGTYENERRFTFEFDADGSVVWTDAYASWPGTYKVSDGVVKVTVSQLGGSVERFDFEIRGNQLVDMKYDNVYYLQK